MKRKLRELMAIGYALSAMVIALGMTSLPMFMQNASAANQVQFRSVEMSSSTPSSGGLPNNLSYDVTFTNSTSGTIKGIVVDFCSGAGTPIIGDATCAKPAGFTVSGSPTFTNNPDSVSNLATVAGWTAASANAGQTFELTDATGTTTNGTTVKTFNFSINTVTNPSSTGTFYARIITYANDSGANSPATYAAGTEGTYLDYGGAALSTANLITLTAKVQETLQFCVSKLAPGPDCGTSGQAVTTPAVPLGHGANTILDSTAVDTNTAFTQLSSNAANGVIVRAKNGNTCGGLSTDGGTTCNIPAAGSTPIAFVAGTAKFGLEVDNGTGGTGTVTANANYHDGTATHYAMNTAATTSTYGDPIMSSSAPINNVGNQLNFAATASNTTPAGIYTGSDSLIATGTF